MTHGRLRQLMLHGKSISDARSTAATALCEAAQLAAFFTMNGHTVERTKVEGAALQHVSSRTTKRSSWLRLLSSLLLRQHEARVQNRRSQVNEAQSRYKPRLLSP